LHLSFGLCRSGLDFGTLDNKPAQFIFLILSPPDTSGPHIQVMAQITRNFKESDVGQRLLDAQNKGEILKIIQNFI
jgi:mannitol/fructose-specific phosphotransferase system IIA component (Ntr-type)